MSADTVEVVYREWMRVDVMTRTQKESGIESKNSAGEDKDVDEHRIEGIGAGDRPVGRGGHAIAHLNGEQCDTDIQDSSSSSAPTHSSYLLIGGADRSGTAFGDVWELRCAFADAASPSQGSHRAADTWTWTRCIDAHGNELNIPPRSGATAVAMGARVVLFGGQDPVSGSCFNDTIILERVHVGGGLSPSVWTWRRSMPSESSPAPPARHSHVCTSASSRLMVLFGGASHTHGLLGDLWIFDTDTESWTHRKPDGESPAPREMAAATRITLSLAPSSAADESSADGGHEHRGLLIHGGRGEAGVLGDAHLLRFRDWRWQKLSAAGSLPAQVSGAVDRLSSVSQTRCAHCAVGISASRVLLCGGFDGAEVTGKAFIIDVDERVRETVDGDSSHQDADGGGSDRNSVYAIVDSIRNDNTAARFASAAVAMRAPPERIGDVNVRVTHVCLVGGVTAEADLADVLLLLS